MALAPHAVVPPAPRRPPEEPETFRWLTAAGWVAVVAVCALFALYFLGVTSAVGRRDTEKAEVEREAEHMRMVDAWMRDTSFNAPPPVSADWPAPTSARAKRMWLVGRMLVDRAVWDREVMRRHGLKDREPPAAWGTPRYWANAGAYPEVRTHLEGHVAAIAEIEKTSAAWLEARTAALARESGMPAGEIRGIFPPDFAGVALDDARLAKARLEIHRDLVRMDPRVHHAGGTQLRYEREDDFRRVDGLMAKLNEANAHARQARARRQGRDAAALTRALR
ncbi:MAG TPA: hypothetical protein VM890_14095 [Longimicrobium sp.]|nr:hypothetical protein [Longimicrobium sp.]